MKIPASGATLPRNAKKISAISFYAMQAAANNGIQKIKKKKGNKPLANIKKLMSSKSSSTVKDNYKLAALQQDAKILPSAVPELAKPDTAKLSKSSPLSSVALKNGNKSLHQDKNNSKKKMTQNGIKTFKVLNSNQSSHSSSVSPKLSQDMKREAMLQQNKSKIWSGKKREEEFMRDLIDSASVITKKPLQHKTVAPQVPTVTKRKLTHSCDKEFVQIETSEVATLPKKRSKASNKASPFFKLLASFDAIKDSRQCGQRVLQYLVSPYTSDDFFNTYFESKLLYIKRGDKKYYDGIFSTSVLDTIIRTQYVEYTKNLDVTSYSEGVRQTHNPDGRVYPSVVWDYFSNGCSLRMLNPQTFHEPVWQVLAVLQERLGSFCGANVYLTPSGTQGFAPHWDDIEAFILQLEGKKRWRVYEPRNINETLPRYSSANLSQKEIGKPILDVVLQAGDLLYFPRGFIHQAEAVEDTHSLHITLSTYQKNAWMDLFEKMFSSESLSQMANTNVNLRKGLPLDCLKYIGKSAGDSRILNSHKSMSAKRKQFKDNVLSLVNDMLTNDVIDSSMDQFARQFVRVALPSHLTLEDRLCTVNGDGERWGSTGGGVKGRVEVEPDTRIKLLSALSVRVVRDDSDGKGEHRLYHSVENSREYEGRPEQFLVLDKKHLPAIYHLQYAYPAFTSVEDLPLSTLEAKITLAMALWEQHLVITEHPLNTVDDDLTSEDE